MACHGGVRRVLLGTAQAGIRPYIRVDRYGKLSAWRYEHAARKQKHVLLYLHDEDLLANVVVALHDEALQLPPGPSPLQRLLPDAPGLRRHALPVRLARLRAQRRKYDPKQYRVSAKADHGTDQPFSVVSDNKLLARGGAWMPIGGL